MSRTGRSPASMGEVGLGHVLGLAQLGHALTEVALPRIALQLARGRVDAAAARLVVFLDNGAEELARLTDALERAWAEHISAQKGYGVEVDDKLVHKGLVHTMHVFEAAFREARDKLASVVDLTKG